MKILVDENIPKRTVELLRENGHLVNDLRGISDQGIDDTEVWNKVLTLQALLITTDKGFTLYRNEPHFGILIVRLKQPNLAKIHAHVMLALKLHKPEEWSNLTLVMRDAVQSEYRYHPET